MANPGPGGLGQVMAPTPTTKPSTGPPKAPMPPPRGPTAAVPQVALGGLGPGGLGQPSAFAPPSPSIATSPPSSPLVSSATLDEESYKNVMRNACLDDLLGNTRCKTKVWFAWAARLCPKYNMGHDCADGGLGVAHDSPRGTVYHIRANCTSLNTESSCKRLGGGSKCQMGHDFVAILQGIVDVSSAKAIHTMQGVLTFHGSVDRTL